MIRPFPKRKRLRLIFVISVSFFVIKNPLKVHFQRVALSEAKLRAEQSLDCRPKPAPCALAWRGASGRKELLAAAPAYRSGCPEGVPTGNNPVRFAQYNPITLLVWNSSGKHVEFMWNSCGICGTLFARLLLPSVFSGRHMAAFPAAVHPIRPHPAKKRKALRPAFRALIHPSFPLLF